VVEALQDAVEGLKGLGRPDRDAAGRLIAEIVYDAFLGIAYFGALMLAGRLVRDGQASALKTAIKVKVLLVGNGWSLCGLHSDWATQWAKGEPVASETEAAFAKGAFAEAWKALDAVPIGKPGAVDLPPTRLPRLEIEVHRLPGKRETARGLVRAPGVAWNMARSPETTSEPIGVVFGNTPPHTVLPMPLAAKDALLGRAESAWGMPERLIRRLGGREKVCAALTLMAGDGSYRKEIAPGGPTGRSGWHLMVSPLRPLLEKNLASSLMGR
jgi:hypothetical protein